MLLFVTTNLFAYLHEPSDLTWHKLLAISNIIVLQHGQRSMKHWYTPLFPFPFLISNFLFLRLFPHSYNPGLGTRLCRHGQPALWCHGVRGAAYHVHAMPYAHLIGQCGLTWHDLTDSILVRLVSSPDPTLCEGKGLVIFERFLGSCKLSIFVFVQAN